ncbi:undecaprenyl-phosphate glucose phosphotransferase [Rhodanobacter sp. FDAARGOS 1247]|uniref:undecaprenyl-phosphate glucose phosphotransferase n=1 Tax=Rhodanobacter sp. FDAARGOS 1247 TaxID=2778082 RepID=UPI0019514DAA|nr:undecaprenyl-phosphate glucose phosphotransferase [Rhodanobacter sp. FDAARGOS 1247]QRP64501.1 undecaprenyl-phosphate glucose phosphotransferase [Rhodanobacter sp. FDAARGOS 1247]
MLFTPITSESQHSGTTFFSKYAALLDIAVRVGDVVILVVAACLCHWLRFDSLVLDRPYNAATLRTAILAVAVFPAFGLYRSWRGEGLFAEIARVIAAWVAVLSLWMMSEWLVKSVGEYSRLWVGGWFIVTIVLLTAHRWMARRLLGVLRAAGVDTRRIVLVGATHAGKRIVAATRKNGWMGLNVVGVVQTPYDQYELPDIPSCGDLEQFIAGLDRDTPDQIWLALPMRAEAEIKRLLDATSELPTTIRLVPDLFGYELLSHQSTHLAGVPVITLRGTRVEGHARIAKAVEDRFLALAILLLVAPLMVLLAIGVKLSSPGPVFYRQKRNGLSGKEIEIWKFRSMRVHHESNGQVTQAVVGDPRVTRFGRFLRASSLDELPQFINVLQGQMSIVGPRPHALAHNRYFSERLDGYMQRHGVKPGITGLAQISGFRGETDTIEKMAQRVECDISYIDHWSIWLDFKIILRTPLVLLRRTNAH